MNNLPASTTLEIRMLLSDITHNSTVFRLLPISLRKTQREAINLNSPMFSASFLIR